MKKNYRTHYDNLKLTPSASAGQIRTAYRRLSKKYHPDRNPDPDAMRVMQLINRAYAVLSDPEARREHDEWIAEQEKAEKMRQIPVVYGAIPEIPELPESRFRLPAMAYYLLAAVLLVSLTAGLTLWLSGKKTTAPTTLYTIYPTAPNGSDWPLRAGYVQGYPQLQQQGEHALELDNPHPTSAVFAQLYTVSDNAAGALRTVFIPARSAFKIEALPAGRYLVRYMRLDSGSWQQAAPLEITQKKQSITLP
ncbi:MAG: J domain-containing protein [Neisseria sp.]|nr:J domain-containing protein [Neisseria sp.]